jgi:hypothetical protein
MAMRDRDQIALLVVGAVLLSAVATGPLHDWIGQQQEKNVEQTAVPSATQVVAAETALAKLTVTTKAVTPKYDRTKFGPDWEDVDIPGIAPANNCDTRSDILRRDMTGEQPATGCRVKSGTLNDPYTGATIQYTSAHASAVQIDHVVALGAAWAQGAWDNTKWTPQRRAQFANDPRNLLAVDGPTNQKKSDDTAEKWAPRPEYRCAWSVKVVTVKAAYKLTVTAVEKDALNRMLGTCR